MEGRLPPELVIEIILLSLPRPSFRYANTRGKLLRTYSLVSPTWYDIAEDELYRNMHIFTSSESTLVPYDEGVHRGTKRRTTTLRLFDTQRSLGSNMLRFAPETVEHLLISSTRLRWSSLVQFQNLTSLNFDYVSIVYSNLSSLKSSQHTFPFVTQLTLNNFYLVDPYRFHSYTIILHPKTFPSLQTLVYTSNDDVYYDHLDLIAPQLTRLFLRATGVLFEHTLFPLLEHLSLEVHNESGIALLTHMLTASPLLKTLRIGTTWPWVSAPQCLKLPIISHMQRLDSLIISSNLRVYEETLKTVQKECEAVGVELRLVDFEESEEDGDVEQWMKMT